MTDRLKGYWTIRKAIWVGHLIITVPCSILFTIPLIITVDEIARNQTHLGLLILAIITGLIISWVYWSYMVTVWKIIAFRKVKNIKGLKKKAISSFLIWPDKHWLSYAEIKSDNQRMKLRAFDRLLFARDLAEKQPLEVIDETNKPHDTEAHINERLNIVEVLFCIISLLAGIYLVSDGDFLLGLIFLVFGIFGSIYEIRQLFDRKAYLRVNDKGIETHETGVISWRNVISAKVLERKRGRRENLYLHFVYHHALDKEKLLENYTELTEFDIDENHLKQSLEFYLNIK